MPPIVPLLVALVPPALIARVIARDAVDVPFMDQWVFGPMVADAMHGVLHPAGLWEPNNEHRVLLPRLVMLGLARLTGWDVRVEEWASFLLALTTLVVLSALIERTVRPLTPRLVPWLVPVAALQTFSLAQWQNWTWGWQMAAFLNVLAATVTAWVIAFCGTAWRGLPWVLLATAAAVLSFASGLGLVVLVPLAFLALGRRDGVERAAIAGVAGGLLLAAYFAGFQPVGNPPPRLLPWSAPVPFARYVTAYLGAGLAAGNAAVASAWGAAGLVVLAAVTARLWTRSDAHRRALVPWLLLALYAVVAAMMTAVGRLGAGPETALLSRYATIAAPFWSSLAVLVALAFAPGDDGQGESTIHRGALVLALIAVILAGDGYRRSWRLGDLKSAERADSMRRGRACLAEIDTAPDPCLRRLCWDAKVLRFFAGPLRQFGIGPFRPRTTPPA